MRQAVGPYLDDPAWGADGAALEIRESDLRAAPGAELAPRPAARIIEPLDLPVLVVNRHFQPVQLTTARRAFVLLYAGSALAMDETGELHDFPAWRRLPVRDRDHSVPIIGGALRVPRVVHLRRYERVRRPSIRLTRKNVMLRDNHQCQYCQRRPPIRDLNIDHVVPRSRGGGDSWENLVTACRPCNVKKGWRTPDEASMHPIRPPLPPRWSTAAQILMGTPHAFEEWGPFLKAG